jgi:(1->4)-alpha-D-glucan 1-alpha-D-glucosylmutase
VQPVSTYRVQLHAGFGFDAAAAVVPYLAELGVTHLYCSPWLTSEAGSTHGYDVVDHSSVDPELGGDEALERLVSTCREAGLGIVLDVVPNHMSVATPEGNPAWWSVLERGQDSPYAGWFDIDWSLGPIVLPVLGDSLDKCLGDLQLTDDRVTYFEHAFPLAPGTLVPGDAHATLAAQHYRLVSWRESDRLSHRRFFDVTTLAGLRVEDPDVFDATHRAVLAQVRDGVLDGLRIDHPDGLADPESYLRRLEAEAPGSWVVIEKILEPGEVLPGWAGAGTTGYDAMQQLTGLFVDPAGEAALTALWAGPSYDSVVDESKRQVLQEVLVAEVERLLDLAVPVLDRPRGEVREALVELLVAFDVYRAYVPAVGPADDAAGYRVDAAVTHACASRGDRADAIRSLGRLALGELGCPEFVTRFQQTCGPVMAKGVEDTTFYRYSRLMALNEVGADPSVFAVSADEFHAYSAQRLRDWPLTMTALSTHDTKRSEDVRARLVLLAQHAQEWSAATREWGCRLPVRLDHGTELMLWQNLLGAWPISLDRAQAYAKKAVREAKLHTSWLAPDNDYEDQVRRFVDASLRDLAADFEAWTARLAPAWRSTVLAQKLVQLTMPGVADCYQGTELVDLSLVDPDNRRPVDFAVRQQLLRQDGGSLDAEKLRLVSTALRLRREHPEWFLEGSYEPVSAADDTLAFTRADRVAVAVPLRGGVVAPPEAAGWTELLPGLPVSLRVRE